MAPDAASPPAAAAFAAAIAASMSLDISGPGTSVLPAQARAGSSFVVAYAVGPHTVLWCDPALADDLASLADPAAGLSLEAFDAWARTTGWIERGRSVMHLLPAEGLRRDRMPDVDRSLWRSLSTDDPADLALVEAFVETLPDDDREEADLDAGEYDEHIVAVVDGRGIAAYASQKPFDHAEGFGDIAVATRPDRRGHGLGAAVVARLCDEMAVAGIVPLYRRDPGNGGSVGLCAALGFVPVVQISAFERPAD